VAHFTVLTALPWPNMYGFSVPLARYARSATRATGRSCSGHGNSPGYGGGTFARIRNPSKVTWGQKSLFRPGPRNPGHRVRKARPRPPLGRLGQVGGEPVQAGTDLRVIGPAGADQDVKDRVAVTQQRAQTAGSLLRCEAYDWKRPSASWWSSIWSSR
jgi:hypothetical protein